MTDSAITLNITTEVEPSTDKMLVDGEEYTILGLQHLSADQELEVTALFSRVQQIAEELDIVPDVTTGKRVAERLRATQWRLLEIMTTMPEERIKKLPPSARAQIFYAIRESVFKAALAAVEADQPEDKGDGDDDPTV